MAELATLALFAYNQEAFIKEAVASALAQTYRPLEIIISDDASIDATRQRITEVLREVPAGISIVRLDHVNNLGLAGAFNQIPKVAQGRVLVFSAGDDISEPDRVARTMAAFADPEVSFVHSAVRKIGAEGQWLGPAAIVPDRRLTLGGLLAGTEPPIVGASCAYRADVFGVFGGLDSAIMQEDVILPVRSLLLGTGVFLGQPLVRYRVHQANLFSPAVAGSSRELVARNQRFAGSRAATCRQWTADFAQLRQLKQAIPPALSQYLEQENQYSQLEQILLACPHRPSRLAAIARHLLTGRISFLKAIKLTGLFVVPSWYATMLNLRIRMSRRSAR